jgi:UDP-3-O-[3-hydroxymyristoyl] N-acetylglucosamine deacetylase
MQTTLRRSVTFSGVGVHSGAPARVSIRPASAEAGLSFRRIDVTDRDPVIPARYDAVTDTRLCTRLSNADGVSISTVEHLLAALAGLGVDNARIDVDGPEIPILDGSAAPAVEAIRAAGVVPLAAPRRALRVLAPVSVSIGGASARLAPAEACEIAFEIDFPDAAIGRQRAAFAITPETFADELADCRTFARRADIEALRAAGLALGGDLLNAVVVDGARVLSPGGFRRPDECVRHKILDAVGDLALAGGPILGRYEGVRAGHGVTNRLLRALFDRPDAWRWEDAPRAADAAEPRVPLAAE